MMLCEKTYKLYLRILKEFLENKSQILNDHILINKYFDNLPATSQRTAIAALKYFKNDFNLTEDEINQLKKNYKKHLNKKEFYYMNADHINKLKIYLATVDLKNKLILNILFDLGVRKFEVAKVVEQYLKSRNNEFNIIGKKGTIRKIYLTKNIEYLFKKSLLEFDEKIILKWTNLDQVYRITKKCFEYIGFNGACHDFRRHFAQNLDEKGERLSVIKTLMGHSNIATTSIYIKQNDNELRQVINNQHKQKPVVDVKHHIELTNRCEELLNSINTKDEMIQNLLIKIESLVQDNQSLKNELSELNNKFKRLKNSNSYSKEIKRIDSLIKRRIINYEKERIQQWDSSTFTDK